MFTHLEPFMRDVLFDDDALTFSKLGAGWLLSLDPRMQIKGFAHNLYQAIKKANDEADAEDINEYLLQYRVIPDSYLIELETRTVYLFGIEDMHPITMNKARKLSQLWFYLDCVYWDMNVLLTNRYLSSWRALPLCDIYYSLAHPDPRTSRENRKRAQRSVNVDWDATHRRACEAATNGPVVR